MFRRSRQRKRDLRVTLLILHIVLAFVVVLTVVVFAGIVRTRLERDVQRADLALAQSIALKVDDPNSNIGETSQSIAAWMRQVWANQIAVITVVDSAGQNVMQLRGGTTMLENSDWSSWSSWQRVVVDNALTTERGSFITTAPNGEQWLHSYVTTPTSDSRVLIQRPTSFAFETLNQINRGLTAAVVLYLLVGSYFWVVLSRMVINPLDTLERFSQQVRQQGSISAEVGTRVKELGDRTDQVGQLSTALVEMEQEIAQQFRQQGLLLQSSQTIVTSLDVTEVMDSILEQLHELFGSDAEAIVELDEGAELMTILASRGLSDEYLAGIRQAPANQKLPAMVALRTQEPVQIYDATAESPQIDFPLPNWQYRSLLDIPLNTRHASPAVLLLYKLSPYHYSEQDLQTASTFANQAAIALDNAALYRRTDERLQIQTRRLEAIVESIDVGLVLESLSGQVLYCNQQAANWVGLGREQAVDLSAVELSRKLSATALNGQMNALENDIQELSRIDNQGQRQDLLLSPFEVTNNAGELLGRGQIWQDVTQFKDVDRMKSALISTASHELRTPLTTIKGYATTLLASDVEWDAAKQQKFLTRISDETDRLAALVGNLLDMSRIEAGTIKLSLMPYQLNELVPQALQAVQPDARERFDIELEPGLPPVAVDTSRIVTVMRNYIENAVKYSPQMQPIQIRTAQRNGHVVFTVCDLGQPIPADIQPKLFDPFYRADNGLNRTVGGFGLGLAISKGFIDAHDGEVWLESGPAGNLFGFKLPKIGNNE